MNMNELDAFRCPLDGMNLIEAGAGTGKTYTIQTLVARILLEQAVPIEKILVVTFTRAATAELRDRVRKVLLSLKAAINGELDLSDSEAGRCQTILANLRQLPAIAPFWANTTPADDIFAKRANGLLANALRDFDQAAISTIHGFCQRMLTENAFESGIRYGMELRSDISDIINALIQQFIRREFYQSGEDVMAVWEALDISWQEPTRDEGDGGNSHNRISTRFFARDIQAALQRHGVGYYWGEELPASSRPECLQAIQQTMAELRGAVKDFSSQACQFLTKQSLKAALESIIATSMDCQAVYKLKDVVLVTEANFLAQFNKRSKDNHGKVMQFLSAEDNSRLLAAFARLAGHLQAYRSCCYRDAIESVQEALAEQKDRDGFMTYDDLLCELKNRLGDKERGPALRQLIRTLFTYALVDEFQDTDPVQYEIFRSVFANDEGRPAIGCGFFMIGDPKQAIYSFRGGDIFTYLQAKEDVAEDRRYTLSTNYRSSEPFIDALNAFYAFNTPWPFAHHKLGIDPIESPKDNCAALLYNGQPCQSPLQFNPWAGNKREVFANCVEQIQAMLQDPLWTLFDGKSEQPRRLAPSDFAVLCRTNNNAVDVERQLRSAKIESVRIGTSNVMTSEAAKLIADLLEALTDPADSRLVIKLLASPFYGLSAKRLYELSNSQDPADSLMAYQKRLAELAHKWQERSFTQMMQSFFGQDEQSVLMTLYKHEDGERILADVLHIVEILGTAEAAERLDPVALRAYFTQQRQLAKDKKGDDSDDNEMLIRMATERNAVILSTIHVSKGLQYPIVFLPDLYSVPPFSNQTSHQPAGGKLRALYDVTDIGTYQKDADHEAMQEKLRVFYVAITRAQYFCAVHMQEKANAASQDVMKYLFRNRQTEAELTLAAAGDAADLAELTKEIVKNGWAFKDPARPKQLYVVPKPDPEQVEAAGKDLADDEDIAPDDDYDATTDQTNDAESPLSTASDGAQNVSALTMLPTPDPMNVNPYWYTISATKLEQQLMSKASAKVGGTAAAADAASVMPSTTLGSQHAEGADEHRDVDGNDNIPTRKLTKADWQALPRIFQLSRGKKTGLCWHSLFEDLAFGADDAGIRVQVEEKLRAYSLLEEEGDVDVVAHMVRQVLSTSLQPKSGGSFKLADVGTGDRLSELQFDYCLGDRHRALTLSKAQLARYALPDQEDFSTGLARALTGSIDLVLRHEDRYYIVDWKSNVIDYDLANFSGDGLRAEMKKHAYGLQYLVYTVALAEYLDDRLGHFTQDDYEALFGGVFYIFLRGVDAAVPGQGVFADRPDYADISALRAVLGRKVHKGE